MANIQGAFSDGQYIPGSVEPASFDDLPAGDYPVIITDSEMKDTKDRTGQYLNLTLQIIGEQHKGRKLFDRLNLINKNATAAQIAKQQLESICRAIGMREAIRDSMQLHNKPFVVRLAYNEKARNGDAIPEGQRNEIKAYKVLEQQSYAPQQTAPAYQPPAPAQQQIAPVYQPPAPAYQDPTEQRAEGTASGMTPLQNVPHSTPFAPPPAQNAPKAPW